MALVFLAGVIYSLYLGDAVRFTDERDYLRLARNLVSSGDYSYYEGRPTAVRTPAYPLLLALILSTGAGLTAVRIAGFLAYAASLCLVFVTLDRAASRTAAWIGTLLVLGYPVLFYTAGTFYAQTVAALLVIGALSILASRGSIGRRRYLLTGLWLALAVLMVPNLLFSLLIVAAWVVYRERRRAPAFLACLLLPAVVLIGAWTARNYAEFHAFVPLTTNGGITLLNGNCATTDPNGSYFDTSPYIKDPEALHRLSEPEMDRYYRGQAIRFIRENKIYAARLYLLKVLNWFHYTNKVMTRGESSRATDLVMLVTYWPLLLLAIVRLLLAFRFPLSRFEILLVALYIGNGLFMSIFLPRIRYRLVFDYGLIMIVAMFLARWVQNASAARATAASAHFLKRRAAAVRLS